MMLREKGFRNWGGGECALRERDKDREPAGYDVAYSLFVTLFSSGGGGKASVESGQARQTQLRREAVDPEYGEGQKQGCGRYDSFYRFLKTEALIVSSWCLYISTGFATLDFFNEQGNSSILPPNVRQLHKSAHFFFKVMMNKARG